MTYREHIPVVIPSRAEGVTAPSDRRAAFRFALQALLILATLAGALLLAEQLILAYPARLGPLVSGFPTERILELEHVPAEIVFMGDSVVQTAATGDTDPRLLPDMLSAEIDEPVLRISQAATGAQMHAAWLRFAARTSPPPRAVIIPINLRSFSPHWERNPGWVFNDTAAMIDHPLYARLASVLEWDWGRPTDEDFQASPVWVNGTLVGTVADLDVGSGGWMPTPEVQRSRYLVRFASDIHRSRRLAAFQDLVREANASAFPVILYLTPIDVDAVRENVEAPTYDAMEANLEVLRSALRTTRWPSVDLSEAVRGPDFDHPPGDPHEHLKWRGRLIVAEALAEAVREAGIGMPAPPPEPALPEDTSDAGVEDAGGAHDIAPDVDATDDTAPPSE